MKTILPLTIDSLYDYLISDIENIISAMPFKSKIVEKKPQECMIKSKFLDFEGNVKLLFYHSKPSSTNLSFELTFEGVTSVGFGLVSYKDKVIAKIRIEATSSTEGVELSINVSYTSPYEKEREKELENLFTKFVENLGEKIVKFYATSIQKKTKKEELQIHESKTMLTTQQTQPQRIYDRKLEESKVSLNILDSSIDMVSKKLGESSFIIELLHVANPIDVETTVVNEEYIKRLLGKIENKSSYLFLNCKFSNNKVRVLMDYKGVIGIWAEINQNQYVGQEIFKIIENVEFTCASYSIKELTLK